MNVQAATSEAHELLKRDCCRNSRGAKTNKKGFGKDQDPYGGGTAESKAARKACCRKKPEPVEIKKMAIPVWSAAQLADKAKREGDAPEIVRDSITKVTLFDYSDIIGGDDEEYEDEE